MEVAHTQSGSSSTWFMAELEFRNVGFWGEGKSGVPGEKPLGAKERTNNKLNPHMASTPGFEPGPNWWEASALTTAPSLAPQTLAKLRLNNWPKVSVSESSHSHALRGKFSIMFPDFTRSSNLQLQTPVRFEKENGKLCHWFKLFLRHKPLLQTNTDHIYKLFVRTFVLVWR